MHPFRSCLLVLALSPSLLASPEPPAARPPKKPVRIAFEGVVTGPDGKPVADAIVAAHSLSASYGDPPLITRTDAAGRFQLPVRRDELHRLWFEARGLAPVAVEKARPGTTQRVALGRGGSIEGTVRDGSSGDPIPGARVQATSGGRWLTTVLEPGFGTREAVTDAKGRYRIDALGSGRQEVTAFAKGFGRVRKPSVAQGGAADFLLFPGSSLAGSVMGPDGKPLAGAVVGMQAQLRGPAMPATERTDATGRFEFFGVEPGSYRVFARAKDLAPALVSGVVVETAAAARADLVLASGVRLVGRLVGTAQKPLTGQIVVQEIDGQPAPEPLAQLLRADAGVDGVFGVEAVPPGAHALAVRSPARAPKRVDVEVRAGVAALDLGDVVVEDGIAVRGRVTDRSGVGIAEARVSARMRRSAPGTGVEARSETDGSFVLAVTDPGTYRLMATAPGFSHMSRDVEAGGEDVTLVLDRGGVITGTAVDDTGRPIESGRVNVEPKEMNDKGAEYIREFDAPDGRFLIEDVAAVTYVLTLDVPDRARTTVSDVKVTPGHTTDVGKVRVRSGGTVRGSVVDTTGAALSGASVLVRSLSYSLGNDDGGRATTDVSGVFEVRGVSPGPAEALASHPSYANGKAAAVEVEPAKGPAEVRIVLSRGGRIEGTARKRDGIPLARMPVRLFAHSGGDILLSWERPSTLTRADGSFLFEHVSAGRTRVALMSGDSSRLQSVQSRDIDVAEAETTVTEFTLRDILVSGHVMRSGAPAPGLRITVRSRGWYASYGGQGPGGLPAISSEPERMTAVTRDDGGYEMLVDEPGEVTARVESLNGKLSFPMRTVQVPDADSFVLDFSLGGISVSGLVVEKETGQPIPRARVQASKKEGGIGGNGGATDEAGRFQIDVESGDYHLTAGSQGRASDGMDVSVGGEGVSGLRLELPAGLVIRGKVVDTKGRPAAGADLTASFDGDQGSFYDYAQTAPDGSFRLDGLRAHPYNLLASSSLAGFALRAGVSPSDDEVNLVLRPAGTVKARDLDASSTPVTGAWVSVVAVGGTAVLDSGWQRQEDAEGFVVLPVPAGTVEILAEKDKMKGKAMVTVSAGGMVSTDVQLAGSGR